MITVMLMMKHRPFYYFDRSHTMVLAAVTAADNTAIHRTVAVADWL